MHDVADRPGLLVLRGVVKAWGDHRVLDGIDLTLAPGQLARILGANGAGKTTLLRVATGMIRPDGCDLAGFLDRRVQRISTGQRQRTRLALAFLHHPDVVLLDEPGNSLDDDGLSLLDRHLGALRLRGGACLWCAPSAGDSAFDFDARYRLSGGGLRPE
jgi:ABC-type multidrug transport system ATPase subunit